MTTYVRCGVELPDKAASPCPLDKGHDGAHYFYHQERHETHSNEYGLRIYNEAGEVEWFLDVEGHFVPEEVGATIAILTAYRERR